MFIKYYVIWWSQPSKLTSRMCGFTIILVYQMCNDLQQLVKFPCLTHTHIQFYHVTILRF